MRIPVTVSLAATALFAQAPPIVEPRLAGLLEPLAAAQFLLPFHGFSSAQLAYAPVPRPALRVGESTLPVPDPLLCSANYVGTEVAQLVFALPQGALVLLDASSSLALHVLAVPPLTWSSPAGLCIDGKREHVVMVDAAGPSLLRIDLADLRAGRAKFQSTPLPPAWSTIRGIAFDFARDRIVGFDPATGDLLQHSAVDPNPRAGLLRPVPELLAFGFAPTGTGDHDLFVSSGDQRLLTSQWTWNAVGLDDDVATLRATVSTASWSPPSPDPSGIAYDNLRDVLIVCDGEVDEMSIYAGTNMFECSRTGIVSRTSTTVGYSIEPTDIAFDSSTRTFYISDDDTRRIYVVSAGPDGLLHTSDDTMRSFSVGNFSIDPEGLAFDNVTRELWIAGGEVDRVFRLRPGNNGIFDGTSPNGDDVLLTVDTAAFGVIDPEGIAVRPADGGIYVTGEPKTVLLHLNPLGQFLRTVTLPSAGLERPAGLVFAPSTVGAGDSLFLVDRRADNDVDPNENDGLMLEYGVPTTAPINQPPIVDAGPDVAILVVTAAHLAGSVADDGLPGGPLTTQWSLLSGPGTATFTAPAQPVTDVSFSAVGTYTCQLSAFDGELTRTDTVVVIVQQPAGSTTVERVIATGNDDAEESPAGTVTRSSTDLEMVLDGTVSQVVGIRFQNVLIPNPALITSAFVQFTTDEAKSTATQLTIAGQASDNAPGFTTPTFNISSRPRTTSTVAWAPVPWTTVNEAGPNQRTPELASIVQQIVNRPGWSPGNALVFVITGTGCRTASAFERNPALVAKLVVTYQSAAPVNQPPVVDAGFDVTTPFATPAHLAGSVTDDDLPGFPLTVQWSLLSGPGTATFTAPTQATTDVSFSTDGTYTCQLAGADGEFTRTDTVVVTVQPAPVNQPPVVNAGPDVNNVMPSAAHLAGTVTDDGLSLPLTIQWSLVLGPGTATFTTPTQASTNVSFSADGSYTCQLEASDGVFTRTDTVVVTVQPAPVNQAPVVDAGSDVTTVITSAAHLAGSVTDDGVSLPLTIQWSLVSGPGTASFTSPTQPVTDVSFSAAGSYTCQLTASDSQFTRTDTVVVTVQSGGSIEQAIANGNDDAEEGPTSVNRTSSDLEIVVDGSVTQIVGIRFQNIQIPTPAAITSAYVQFTTDQAKSIATQLTIAGQASDNALGFTTTAANISSRPRTTNTVAWAPVPWTIVNEAGPNQRTPNLASIVQQIVNRPGWSAGNAMVFVITGTGCRTASAFERGPAFAAKLIVTYQAAAPINQPPVVSAGPDVSTPLASAAHLVGAVTDDGLPGGPLTIQWSLLSGPGTASFTTPAQAVTDVSFSAPGSYTCQLAAADGEFTRTDTVVVTVQPPPVNQPPVVNAGPDVTTVMPSAAHLAGSVSDDGLSGPLTIQWSLLSGPGTASFTTPAQAVTDVSFSAAGSYTCQLLASDDEFTRTDTVVVTVQAAPVNQPPVVNAGPDVSTLLSAAAHLTGSVGDDGLSLPLTIEWSLVSGPGTASFTAPTQPVTDVSFSAAGSYTCQLTASDSEFTRTDTVVVTVQAGISLERAITNSHDDAEEIPGSVTRSGNDLEMTVDGTVTQVVGLRFLDLTIPAGAVITSAYVQFTTKEAKSEPTQLTIAGNDTDNAATFKTTANSISNRPRTTATAVWAPVPWTTVNEAGPNQRTPDLSSIVQEIVSRPGWSSGNAMVFVVTGTGCRTASSYDLSPTVAPRLIITYQ